MAKRRALPPRRLRTSRQQRLQSARTFIRNFSGRSIARGYSRWYGVDRRCAVLELKMLGVRLNEHYVKAVFETARLQEERGVIARTQRAEEREAEHGGEDDSWSPLDDENDVPF